jgi:nitrilase
VGRPGTVPGLEQQAFARLWHEGVDVPGPETERLGEAARTAGAQVVIGVNEREAAYGRATLYNTLLTFGPDGQLLGRHRKVMPTYKERTVWGAGDGSTLGVQETPLGRVGGLICWENFMPLVRYHQYAQGAQVLVAATVDDSPSWGTLMQAIAAEGRIYVIAVCQRFARSQFPDEPLLSGFAPEADVLSGGGSMIVAPGGSVLAGPLTEGEGIITAEIDLGRVIRRSIASTSPATMLDLTFSSSLSTSLLRCRTGCDRHELGPLRRPHEVKNPCFPTVPDAASGDLLLAYP